MSPCLWTWFHVNTLTHLIQFLLSAPKPAVWSPGGQKSTGQAPAAKPFSPHVTPAPPAPKGPLPKPTGVGAVRGKIGDAVMRTGGTPGGPERVPVCHSCGTAIRFV